MKLLKHFKKFFFDCSSEWEIVTLFLDIPPQSYLETRKSYLCDTLKTQKERRKRFCVIFSSLDKRQTFFFSSYFHTFSLMFCWFLFKDFPRDAKQKHVEKLWTENPSLESYKNLKLNFSSQIVFCSCKPFWLVLFSCHTARQHFSFLGTFEASEELNINEFQTRKEQTQQLINWQILLWQSPMRVVECAFHMQTTPLCLILTDSNWGWGESEWDDREQNSFMGFTFGGKLFIASTPENICLNHSNSQINSIRFLKFC